MTPTAGIDPGKKGYECAYLLSGDGTGRNNYLSPIFWPSCVRGSGDEDDDRLVYDIGLMVQLCRDFYRCGVRLIALEIQAPRGHGTKAQLKWGQGREGTKHAFELGRGIGLWEAALVAAGYVEVDPSKPIPAEGFYYVKVDPQVWKPRMGARAHHSGADDHAARRKAADVASIAAARRLEPNLDLRALERTPGARTESPDKSCALLLARYARWLLERKSAS
jgi:hypothetical protein